MAQHAQNHTNPLVIDATGYTPYAAARIKRTEGRLIDTESIKRAQAIKDYWVKRNFLSELHSYVGRHESEIFRSKWECAADKQGLYNRVQWEMGKVTAKMQEELEKRRSRLSEMLKSEEEMYLQEASTSGNVGDKTAQMQDRYKELVTKKEQERAKVVKEKKDQHFRINCDELRGLISKKIQKEVAREGQLLMNSRESEVKQKNDDEKMYADMWVKDYEMKCEKEAEEKERQKNKDREFGRYITEQMEKNKREKLKGTLQKEQDAKMMAEQKRLLDMEEEWKVHEKIKKQKETKKALDQCLKSKLKQKTKEVQEDIMEDMFYLKKIMEDDEKAKKAYKKKTLMKEQQQYLAYLNEQLKKEAEFEKELDKTYQEEFEQMWVKREKEWEAEKKKRKQFEKDVLLQCEEQILVNIEKSKQAQAMHNLFAKKVLEQDDMEKKEDQEKLRLIKQRNEAHQKEILEQMRLKAEKLKAEEALRARELEIMTKERKAHEEKLQNLISEMKLDFLHPYRTRGNEVS